MSKIPPYYQAKGMLTLKEKVGQFFMPAAFINDSEDEIQKIENLIKNCGIGSVCFFHSRASAATNYEGKKEVIYNAKSLDKLRELIARYQTASKYPLLIAIDAEWGLAMRVEQTPQYPYALTLGAIKDNPELIEAVGEHIGVDCKKAGIHWNLCPSVDINNNPDNPVIGYRSFGDEPEEVYQRAKAFINGMNKSGVLNSIKHFPGHGDTSVDSHLGLPRIDKSKEELLKNELFPFKQLIQHKVDSVMVGHLAVPAISHSLTKSSTISKPIVTDLIRKEFKHSGVIITDALNMHSVSKLYDTYGQLEWEAFEAGNDVLCFAEHTAEGIELILKNGSEEQIEESFQRVWRNKEKGLSGVNADLNYNYEGLIKSLAENTLTTVKGNEKIIQNIHDSNFELLEFGKKEVSLFGSFFTDKINAECNNKLITLFPPEMKPTNNFGFTKNEIEEINILLNSSNCVLYVFGNPYTLRLFDIENAAAVMVAYQDFEVFQKNAIHHFNGELSAKGQLPVKLN